MKNKDGMLKILAGVTAVIIVGFFCLKLYEITADSYTTQTAYEQTVLDTIDVEMYIVRDEMLLSSDSAGVIVPIAANGGRVSRGSEIAAVFASEAQANNYIKLQNLQKKLASYEKINSQLRLANLDIGKLSSEIDTEFISILDSAYNNDFVELEDTELSFAEKLSRKQISLDQTVDCSEKIAELQSQIAALSSSSNPQKIITAEYSGYYVSKPDGLENIITCDDIDSLSEAQLNMALTAERKDASSNSLGKIINGYNWYVAAVINTAGLSDYKTGDKVNLILGDSSDDMVATVLHNMISLDKDRSIAVFRCNLMNDSLSTIRRFKGKIVVNEYTGLKVRKDAIRVDENGNSQVFVRRGNIVDTRSLNIIYSENDFVLAVKPAENSDIELPKPHLKLYDEVIISGKDIYDGMVIG